MSKCNSTGCPQAVFRDNLCVDHFRLQAGGGRKLVAAIGEEKIDDALRTKFKAISGKVYVDQAKWYLNAFWTDGGETDAEEVWTTAHKFIELDPKKKKGNELDHVLSSHYLQGLGKPLTALELKEELRRIDVDANGMMALVEYLLFKYKKLVTPCVNNPQGSLDKEAQAQLEAAQAKVDELTKAVADEQEAEAKVKAAEAEARAADAELKRQQDELNNKMAELDAKTKNQSLGQVARNKAVQELAQLRGQDPLPLRRAKITQEAAVRRLEQARKIQEDKTRLVEKAFNEAMALLQELKKRAAAPMGSIWWMEREVKEAKKYKPRSQQ